MGYDFTSLELPDELARLRDAADRDPSGELLARYLREVEPFTYHLNIAGMGLCRKHMHSLGMLAEGAHAPFPPYPTWDRALYATDAEHRHANPTVWEEYAADELAASKQRGTGSGIARFKFESNGPWIVVQEEIDGALAAFADHPREKQLAALDDPLFADWMSWLRTASAGFEVR